MTAMQALPPLLYVTHRRLMGEGPEILDTFRAAMWSLPPFSIMAYVREPDLEGLALAELCKAFVAAARDASQLIVVRDRLDVARYVGADGVHLPEDSMSPTEARALWPQAVIGRSIHSVEAVQGLRDVDYAVLSPIFATESHPEATPLGIDGLYAAATTAVPIYALGGIDAKNAEQVFATGVHGVAMMREAWRQFRPER